MDDAGEAPFCDSSRPTGFGWDAFCSLPAGHVDAAHPWHESADFRWTAADSRARVKDKALAN